MAEISAPELSLKQQQAMLRGKVLSLRSGEEINRTVGVRVMGWRHDHESVPFSTQDSWGLIALNAAADRLKCHTIITRLRVTTGANRSKVDVRLVPDLELDAGMLLSSSALAQADAPSLALACCHAALLSLEIVPTEAPL